MTCRSQVQAAATWAGFAALAGLTFATTAYPQAPPLIAANAQPGETLEQVIVTATRRTEDIQKIPAAVSAIGSQELEQAGVQNFQDLANLTPSLSVVTGIGGNNFLNIRGVGIGVSTPFQSAGVPLHVDGLYLPRSEFFLQDAYFDIDHVEVYRGPQGTFAGQNSTGGAIFVVSNQPRFDRFSADIQQLAGNYHWLQTQAAVNMPLNDVWAVRLAINAEQRDGFTNNLGTQAPSQSGIVALQQNPRDPGNLNRQSVRAIVRYRPSDDLDFRLRYDYLNDKNNGLATVRSIPNTRNDPSLLANPWQVSYDFPQFATTRIDRLTFNADWHLNTALEFKSVTGYQYQRTNGAGDADASTPYLNQCVTPTGSPQVLVPSACAQSYSGSFSTDSYWFQEFDLLSTYSGPLQWVMGIDAFHRDTPIHTFSTNYVTDPNVLNGNLPPPGSGSLLDYFQHDHSEAAFAQVTYSINNHWQLIAGGRYTYYEVQLNPDSTVKYTAGVNPNPNIIPPTNLQTCGTLPGSVTVAGFPTLPNLCNVYGRASYSQPTGRVALNWFPAPDWTVYASASSGFKQGGYQTQFTLQTAGPQPQYKQENIYDYELGLKTTTLGGHLRLNTNVFYEDYRNLQASFRVIGTVIPRSINIDKSRIYGFETSADVLLGDFRVAANVGYDNSRVTANATGYTIPQFEYGPGTAAYRNGPPPPQGGQFVCSSSPTTPTCLTFVGTELNYSPRWTGDVAAEYAFHLWGGTLTPRLQWSYIDQQWDTLFHATQDFIPSHMQLDARLAYVAAEHWRLEGFVLNAANKLYIAGVAGGAGATPYASLLTLGAPRQIGVRLAYSF